MLVVGPMTGSLTDEICMYIYIKFTIVRFL